MKDSETGRNAGVGDSVPLDKGFVVPIQTSDARQINAGIAVMNLEDLPVTITLELLDKVREIVSTTTIDLSPGRIEAFYVTEGRLNWSVFPDFSNFEGTLRASNSGLITAMVLQTRPGYIATFSVSNG